MKVDDIKAERLVKQVYRKEITGTNLFFRTSDLDKLCWISKKVMIHDPPCPITRE